MKRRNVTARSLFAAVIALGTASTALADDFEWTGFAGNNLFTDPNNWLNTTDPSAGGFPGNADNTDSAFFPIDATISVDLLNLDRGITNLGIASQATLSIDSSNLIIFGGTITNDGELTFADQPGSSTADRIGVLGDVLLTGAGELVLVNGASSIVADFAGGSANLINDTGHTIRGQGQLRTAVTNDGTIIAEEGTLLLFRTDNTNGTIQAGSDTRVRMEGQVTGGTINLDSGAQLTSGTVLSVNSGIAGSNLTLDASNILRGNLTDTTVNGVIAVRPGNLLELSLAGTITNNGTITFIGDTSSTSKENLIILGETTLTGDGELILVDSDSRVTRTSIDGVVTDGVLTNDADHTIRGQGSITVDLINKGQIIAEGGLLSLSNITTDNTNGSIRVASNATLRMLQTDNTGGTIAVESNAVLVSGTPFIPGSGVSGGTVTLDPAGSVLGTLTDVTLEGTTVVTTDFDPFESLTLAGKITNNGTITFAADPTTTTDQTLSLIGPVTLAGSGELTLVDDDSQLFGPTGDAVLTHASGHTIRGQGFINTSLVNQSDIIAEGGTLAILASGFTQTAGGTLHAAADGVIDFGASNTVTVTGGTLAGQGTIVAAELINNGATVSPGSSAGTLTLDSDYTHTSDASLFIEIAGEAPGEFDLLRVLGNIDLQGGTLQIALLSGSEDIIAAGTTFDIITADDITGSFDQVIIPTDSSGSPLFSTAINDGIFTLTATQNFVIPEPASLTLLALGIAALTRRPRGDDAPQPSA
ncbi:MAG: PEP-CTERM sorting domain-containing protein [Planctomycetota bacterium]